MSLYPPAPGNGVHAGGQSVSSPNQMTSGVGYQTANAADNALVLRESYAPYQAGNVPPSGPPMIPYSTPGAAGATRPFDKRAISGTGVSADRRESRVASIITILILVATLLLLGFSVYLASALGFLQLFPSTATPTPTATSATMVQVPNLVNMKLADAQTAARNAGFVLEVSTGPQDGIVVKQSPQAGFSAQAGSTIRVELGTATPTVTVPENLAGKSLADVDKILKAQNIPYSVQYVGIDPNQGPDTVIGTDPAGGAVLPAGKTLIVRVVNNSKEKPTATPTAAPTLAPSPSPSPSPSPDPKPSPKPSPSPSPSPSPGKGSPTPGAGGNGLDGGG